MYLSLLINVSPFGHIFESNLIVFQFYAALLSKFLLLFSFLLLDFAFFNRNTLTQLLPHQQLFSKLLCSRQRQFQLRSDHLGLYNVPDEEITGLQHVQLLAN